MDGGYEKEPDIEAEDRLVARRRQWPEKPREEVKGFEDREEFRRVWELE